VTEAVGAVMSVHRLSAGNGFRTCCGTPVPVIRLHDLRHTWATLALTAGIPAKEVQGRLGHSRVAITWNIHSHVTPQLHSEAAVTVAGLIVQGDT